MMQENRFCMPAYIKKQLPPNSVLQKPAVNRLNAEVPWNYIIGRLAAALQSFFCNPEFGSRCFFILDYIQN